MGGRKLALQEKGAGRVFFSRAPAVPHAFLCSRILGRSGGSSDPWGCPRLPQAEMSCGQWLLQAGMSPSPRHLDFARALIQVRYQVHEAAEHQCKV